MKDLSDNMQITKEIIKCFKKKMSNTKMLLYSIKPTLIKVI